MFQARFDDDFCLNVIVDIGFGSGKDKIKITGGDPEANFLLPLRQAGNIVRSFEKDKLQDELNFDWFKFNVLCAAQKWICVQYPVNATNLLLSR